MHDLEIPNGNMNLHNIIITKENIKLSNLAKTSRDEFKAPENFNSDIYTLKSDIWGLGVILYRLVYGILPYSGTST